MLSIFLSEKKCCVMKFRYNFSLEVAKCEDQFENSRSLQQQENEHWLRSYTLFSVSVSR